MSESVARLARRVAVDPFFLAFALREYAQAEGLDDAALADRLGTTSEVLHHVALCQAPAGDPEGFCKDVDRIAQEFRLSRETLAVVARHGQIVAALRPPAEEVPPEAGFLIAARDRDVS